MPKDFRATKGMFLTKKLSKSKIALIKRWFSTWHQTIKGRDDYPDEMSEEVLQSFFDFLGFKDEAFTGLPDHVYDSKHNVGTKMIEDFLKKKMFRGEEKPATRQNTSAKKK